MFQTYTFDAFFAYLASGLLRNLSVTWVCLCRAFNELQSHWPLSEYSELVDSNQHHL